MDVERYLARIAYQGPRASTADTLAALQRAHIGTVAFESLDCVASIPLSVTPEALWDKIVGRGRGGFCFELNGLFSELLRALGFDVTLLAARPFWSDGIAPERAHLTLVVSVDGERWLTDVGFGHWTPDAPLLLDDQGEQVRGARTYRIVREGDRMRMTMGFRGEASGPAGFVLSPAPRALDDFAEQCLAYSTDPDSPFARGGVYSLRRPDGWLTVTRNRMIRTVDGVEVERPVANDDEWRALLFEHFGVTV